VSPYIIFEKYICLHFGGRKPVRFLSSKGIIIKYSIQLENTIVMIKQCKCKSAKNKLNFTYRNLSPSFEFLMDIDFFTTFH